MRQNLLKNLLAVFLLVMSTGLAMSQGVTTSGITGTVTEANGQALPGANVVATHLPSGTRYGAGSNVEGNILFQGCVLEVLTDFLFPSLDFLHKM